MQNLKRRQSAGYMTNWAARLFARAIDRHVRELGVASGQMPVFFALGDGGSLPQKALARRASVEQPTMAATLARMQRDGLIERRPDPDDGRSQLVSLTPRAMELARQVREKAILVNGIALSALTEEERARYMEFTQRIVAALEASLAE